MKKLSIISAIILLFTVFVACTKSSVMYPKNTFNEPMSINKFDTPYITNYVVEDTPYRKNAIQQQVVNDIPSIEQSISNGDTPYSRNNFVQPLDTPYKK